MATQQVHIEAFAHMSGWSGRVYRYDSSDRKILVATMAGSRGTRQQAISDAAAWCRARGIAAGERGET